MSVRKIRQSWWVDFRHEGVRYRKRSPENTMAGAKAYEALLRQRLARGEALGSGATQHRVLPTFREFAKDWMDNWVRSNNKPTSAQGKASILRRSLLPCFGDRRLDQITEREIERYKASRTVAGRHAHTINNELAVLAGCLRIAAEWSLLKSVPRVRWVRAPYGPVRFLSPEEARALVEAADAPLWHDMILVALHTGVRYGELAALEWPDVDLAARRIAIRRNFVQGLILTPKNHRERHLPLTMQVRDALVPRQRRSGLVFPWKNGRPVCIKTAAGALKRACRRVGIEPVGWHKLRHTFASHLVAKGVPLPTVQQLLGHATITMTMRYAHLAPNALVNAIEVLDWERAPKEAGHSVGNAVSPALCVPQPAIAV